LDGTKTLGDPRALEGIKNSVSEGLDTCIATVFHRDNVKELGKLVGLSKELGTRFMYFNYIPTGRARSHFDLDLTPNERFLVLEALGKEIVDLYVRKKEEEIKTGKSSINVDRFFSTCPQFASVTKELSRRHGENFIVEAHYAAKQGIENVANFLGGCGAGRLYCCLEPNGDIKPCVFFQTSKETVLGNILKDDFETIWDTNPLLWKLRTREHFTDCAINGEAVGCAKCSDRYICGGCRARAFSYFGGNVTMPDVGCIHNEPVWEELSHSNRNHVQD
jgi:radical SAM protein with 4Fe4S-binding SPASM domain